MNIFGSKDNEDDEEEESNELEGSLEETNEDNEINELKSRIEDLESGQSEMDGKLDNIEGRVSDVEEENKSQGEMIEKLSGMYQIVSSKINPFLPDSVSIPNLDDDFEKTDQIESMRKDNGDEVIRVGQSNEDNEDSNKGNNEDDSLGEVNEHREDLQVDSLGYEDDSESSGSFPINRISEDNFPAHYILLRCLYETQSEVDVKGCFSLVKKYNDIDYISDDFYNQIVEIVSDYLIETKTKFPELMIYHDCWDVANSKEGKYKVEICPEIKAVKEYEYVHTKKDVVDELRKVYGDPKEVDVPMEVEKNFINMLILLKRHNR